MVLVQKDAHDHAILIVVSHPVVTDHYHCHSLELVSVEAPVMEIVVEIAHSIHFQLLLFLTHQQWRSCTHTHLSHAHFSASQRAHCALRTSSCVSHTRMAQVPGEVHCTCVISLHIAFSLLMIHPSSVLFFDGHFETTPDLYDFTDNPIYVILPYLPVLKTQDTRNSAPASQSLATWPDWMQTQELGGNPGGR